MPEASALSNAESKGINVSKTYKPKFSRAALACCAAFCCLKSTFTITTAWLTFKLLNKLASSTVNSTDFEDEKNEETIVPQSGLFFNFIGGFIGSVIGTLTILFLYMNEYLPLDLLKIK